MSARARCGCGKATFNNRGKALLAADLIRRSTVDLGQRVIPVRAYPCPRGVGWHLTSIDGDRAAHPQVMRSA